MKDYLLTKDKVYFYAVFVLLVVSLVVRAINLNYNSPFNDEAIYIVLGRLGIFQGDWWSYNAAAWMAGQPYIYPPLTAIAYVSGGVVGSRLLNVIFGVLTIESVLVFTSMIANFSEIQKKLAGIIAAVILAISSVSLYVSRLATYDMPSFYFLFLSLVLLLKAQRPNENYGKWFFLSALFLFLSFMTKIIIVIYIPFILLYSYVNSGLGDTAKRFFWKRYFLIPLLSGLVLYSLFNWSNLVAYFASQNAREKSTYLQILITYWQNSRYIWPLWLVGSIGMFLKRKWRSWGILTGASLLILLSHLASSRWPTLDKHTFLSIAFLACVAGVGISDLIVFAKERLLKIILVECLIVLVIIYSIASYVDAQRFNNGWHNGNTMLSYLQASTHPGDKVLAEVGAGAILVNYDNNYPTYTTTFDWFEYKKMLGDQAYLNAIKDGYFDTIELDGGDSTSELIHSKLHNLVRENLAGNYNLVYSKDDFVVYKRAF